jgi:hypothetical protein
LVDAQLPLHRGGRQADLVADDVAAPSQRILGEQSLYRIRRGDVALAQDLAHRVALAWCIGGGHEPVGCFAQRCRGEGHEVDVLFWWRALSPCWQRR